MTVRWTPTGPRDLESLHAYIAEDNESAAAGIVERIIAALDTVCHHPYIGRRGRVAGTRELVTSPFVVAYRVEESVIEVVAIIHGARRWPDSF